MGSLVIDRDTLCANCDKPWAEHWGFGCDKPWKGRSFKPEFEGEYPHNRGCLGGTVHPKSDWAALLSANLAMAGFGCEAFHLGGAYLRSFSPSDWHPGCGRPAKKGG